MLIVSIQLGLYLLLVISIPCIHLLGLFEQCSTNWVAYNARTLLSHSSGDYRSEIKVWAGLVPSGGTEGECVPCLSSGLQQLPTILLFFGCCHMAFSRYLSLSLYPNYLLLMRTPLIGLGPTLVIHY